ncbi:unnamed protein product [Medioppia subpectinata]|uniref:Uncharacterized protein n=1 Tax=Medioppia subpectinata TaxID=1979941 RepID=A0A7R9KW45_9ACAR|nr:unnamed protein product [Medioppia subpectinata]CAG2109830.1 unnamed protein product [Medioppia subpectinata]
MFYLKSNRCLLLAYNRLMTTAGPNHHGQFIRHMSAFPVDQMPVFKSGQSLDRLYPKSSTTSTTSTQTKCHLPSADWLPLETRERIKELHKNTINKDGHWIIRSDKTRAQLMNLADCMDKMRCYITEAQRQPYTPSVETLEKIRENREKAAVRRLEQKKNRSMVKSSRRSID